MQVPSDADSPKFRSTTGTCKWLPEKSAVSWQIKSFPGGKEFLMRASFGLPSVESDEIEGKPPIQVWNINHFCVRRFLRLTSVFSRLISIFSDFRKKSWNWIKIKFEIFIKLNKNFLGKIWDSVLHRFWHPSSLFENYREIWLSSSSLGQIHYSKRRLPASNEHLVQFKNNKICKPFCFLFWIIKFIPNFTLLPCLFLPFY